ncbi:type II toxin-antitoxin system HicA family toxin [Bacteroidota bacterium]
MSKQPVINAKQGEKLLLKAGYELIRKKGSHRIYQRGANRIVIPFHGKKDLHPNIVKSIFEAIEK